jgi:hypothetical protein
MMKICRFKPSYLLSLGLGAMLMLGMTAISPSDAQSRNHVFELRTYHANPGKLEDLKTRFRNHTIDIFNRHHMKSVGYWIPEQNTGNLLIYILEHPSHEEALANWKAFHDDPEWQKVAKASEANGKLVDHVDSVYMDPADFSAIK